MPADSIPAAALVNPVALLILLVGATGWGQLLRRLSPHVKFVWPLLGLAWIAWILQWTALFHRFTPAFGTALVLVGACIAIMDRRRLLPARISRRDATAILVVALLLVFAVTLPIGFNLADDGTAYSVFPLKIRALGGIGTEPFSERRLFSLGAQYPLHALLLSYLPLRGLAVLEPGIAIALCALLVYAFAEPGTGRSTRGIVAAAFLCALLFAGSAIMPNLAPAYLMVPPLLVLIATSMRALDRNDGATTRAHAVLLGVVSAFLMAMRPTAAPACVALVAVALLPHAGLRAAWPQWLADMGLAGLSAALFVMPFSLDLLRSSGTLLYPVLGRGLHASALGAVPTIPSTVPFARHFVNLIAIPARDPLFWCAAILWVWTTCIAQRDAHVRRRAVAVLLIVVANYWTIIIQSGGLSAQRYESPMLIALILFSFARLPVMSRHAAPRFVLLAGSGVGALVATMLLVAPLPLQRTRLGRAVWAKIEIRERSLIPTGADSSEYTELQRAIPPGATVLSSLERTYLLDPRRNHIVVNDQPEMVGPAPGWPRNESADAVLAYLRSSGIDYVAVMRHAEQAGFASNMGWAGILENAYRRFGRALRDPVFTRLIVYSTERVVVYRVVPPGPVPK